MQNNAPINNIQLESSLKTSSQNYLKAWSENDTTLLNEAAIRHIVRNVNGEIVSSNQHELYKNIKFWHTALPDFKMMAQEINILGNRTFINWKRTGTNTGMFGEITPTGKKSSSEGFSILTFNEQQQLIHVKTYVDVLGVMRDIGYTMQPPNTD
ncbi:ester cyclase [Aurantibacter sp.]|uniref:ester cyclase n=1 Tax=Aurantibacter sp. TaxID=2807103 RepID=UPI003267381A